MTNIAENFRALTRDNGALALLETSVLRIRDILLKLELSEEEAKTYGHGGVPGEYINSLWPIYNLAQKLPDLPEDQKSTEVIELLLQKLRGNSQMSISQEAKGDAIPTIDAFPIGISLTEAWVKKSDKISDPDKCTLLTLLTDCSAQFTEIKSFFDRHQSIRPL